MPAEMALLCIGLGSVSVTVSIPNDRAPLDIYIHRFSYCFNTYDRAPLDMYILHISRHECTRHRAVNLYSGSIKAALRLYYGTIKVRIVRLRLYYEEAVFKRKRQY